MASVEIAASSVSGDNPLFKNVSWNIVGLSAPSLVALYAFPRLIHGFGADRFGMLTLVWALVGTASIFDLGLNRALTAALSTRMAEGSAKRGINDLIWISLLCVGLAGAAVGCGVALAAPWLVHSYLNIPHGLQIDALRSLRILGLCIPCVLGANAFIGILAALHRFDYINAVRIPAGIVSFVGPLISLHFSANVSAAVIALTVARASGLLAYAFLCLRLIPTLLKFRRIKWDLLPSLLQTGGWMTVSTVVSTVNGNIERFILGSLCTLTVVAHYATPNEIISRTSVISVAISGVLFPSFASHASRYARTGLREVCTQGHRYLLMAAFPLLFTIAAMAEPGLRLWLGWEFAAASWRILQILAVCGFLNSLNQMPLALLQASGNSKTCARFQLLEAPFYLLSMWASVTLFGGIGAAGVNALRLIVEMTFFMWAARRVLGEFGKSLRTSVVAVAPCLLAFGAAMALTTDVSRLVLLSCVLACFFTVSWRYLIPHSSKARLSRRAIESWVMSTFRLEYGKSVAPEP